tara:strand:+ start:3886 stop:4431 length:546 start_codon:yes stop_codon:yes gene_type:complete
MDKEAKEGGFGFIFIVLLASLAIAYFWSSVPMISGTVHSLLDPSAGALLDWNTVWGMTLLIFIISVFMTLTQKYGTDQATLKELKAEQKVLQAQMKEFKHDPAKVMELQKKQFEFIPLMMKHSMRPIVYTGIPLILFFRWFMDYFAPLEGFRFFGFFSWFWYYLIVSIIFSSILRKVLKVH